MDYSKYNSSHTISYKQGYIHCASFGSNEVIRVVVDKFAYPIQVKSIYQAKLWITNHAKKYGSISGK